MIGRLKALAKRHWPALRLRTILFSVLLFVAALPGVSAIFLRVYENTLVRQTEAELIAQAAALAATATAFWPSQNITSSKPALAAAGGYRPEPLAIDLGSTPVLAERPKATRDVGSADPAAETAAHRLAPILKTTSQTTLASIVLTDSRGQVLIGAETGGSYAGLPEMRAALGGSTQTTLRRNGAYRELWPEVGDGGVRKAAYRGGCGACQNLSRRAIRHDRSYQCCPFSPAR